MADDEVQTPVDPPHPGRATPQRGKRREPPTIEGTATDVAPETPAAEPGMIIDEPAGTELAAAAGDGAPAPSKPGVEALHATSATEQPEAATTGSGGGPTTPETPPSAPAPRSKTPLLLTGLGAVLVVLLGAVLYALYNPPANDAVASLTGQVNDLKQQVASLQGKAPPPPVDLKPLDTRVTALENRPAAPPPDLKPIEDRVAALESATGQLKSDLADLQGKVAQAAPPAAATTPAAPATAQPVPAAPQAKGETPPVDLAPVEKEVADLQNGQKALQEALAAAPKVDLAPLQKQVSDLVPLQKQVADLAPLPGRVDDLAQKLGGVTAAVAALPKIDLAPLEQKIDGLDHRLSPIEAMLAQPKSTEQVTEDRRNGSAAETRAAPVAVTGQAVLDAIREGHPFAADVATLEALGTDPKRLAPLKAIADKGAPTQSELVAGFQANEGKMVGPGAPAPGGGVLDRMMAGAQNLVKVRPEGASPGQDPDAVVSRIGDDVGRSDYRAALAEWAGLPEEGRKATQAWADQVKARADAEEAASAIVADAITAIGAQR